MIEFDNCEDSLEREERLIRTYLRLGGDIREVVKYMYDEKGTLEISVSKILPNLTEQIRAAWAKEEEYHFQIYHNKITIYSTFFSL